MNKGFEVLIVVFFLTMLLSCDQLGKDQPKGELLQINLDSVELQRNRNGQVSNPPIHIYLPAGYDPNRYGGYGVIYYLGGYGAPSDSLFNEVGGKAVLDRAMADGVLPECIVVGLTGQSRYGGHFFTNSDTSGYWESYVINDVISYMDSHYNTLGTKESRGLCGFSMGGYGALSIGLKYPNLFQAVFAFSPGLFDSSGFSPAVWDTWDHLPGLFMAYGAAFTPSAIPNDQGIYAEYPPEGENSPYESSWNTRWSVGYGNIPQKVEDYAASPRDIRLNAVRIDVGSADHYTWLVQGSSEFHSTLQANGLPSELNEYPGKIHSFTSSDVENLARFFAGQLRFQ